MTFDPQHRKILYVSDTYAQNVWGTKLSLRMEMSKLGYEVEFFSVHSSGKNCIDGNRLLKKLGQGFTDLWIAHTWIDISGLEKKTIRELGVKTLGFGFSDPYAWNEQKLKWYDAYATNHYGTYRQLGKRMPCTYFPTACDLNFHRDLALPRNTDIIMFGTGQHSRFTPHDYRITTMQKIISRFPNNVIKIYGDNWGKLQHGKPLSGKEFLIAINNAKLSLDLQQDHAPLAHRMFESMACGCPVITKARKEVDVLLNVKTPEVLTYASTEGLLMKIEKYLDGWENFRSLAANLQSNTAAKHSMVNRVRSLLSWLNTIKF